MPFLCLATQQPHLSRISELGRISGDRHARQCVLYQAALVSRNHNVNLKIFGDHLRVAGKPHKASITAVARKLVTIIALVNDQRKLCLLRVHKPKDGPLTLNRSRVRLPRWAVALFETRRIKMDVHMGCDDGRKRISLAQRTSSAACST